MKIKDTNPKESAIILVLLEHGVNSIGNIKNVLKDFQYPEPNIEIKEYKSNPDEEDFEMGCTPEIYYEIKIDEFCDFGEFQNEFEAYRYGIIRKLLGF